MMQVLMSVLVDEIRAPLPTRWTSELQVAALQIGAHLSTLLMLELQVAALDLLGWGSCWYLQLSMAVLDSRWCCLEVAAPMPWYWNFLVMISRRDNHLHKDQPQQVRIHKRSGHT
jgi:hypothetical protein